MKCIVVASIIVAAVSLRLATAQFGQPPLTGTCASIGYADRCCPPGGNCRASDGNCHCDARCHSNGNCCTDRFCSSAPMTCQQVGWTNHCCTISTHGSSAGACDVMHPGDNDIYTKFCSCDMGCHLRNDCCSDIAVIGCGARNCTPAGKDPGCCRWGAGSSCLVSASNCYCDSYCVVFGDCCEDVPLRCPDPSSQNRPVNVQTDRRLQEDLMKALHTQQQYKLQRPSTNTESSNAAYYNHHRMAISSRLETARRMNQASEFRGRARVAQRPPYYYNNGYNNY